MNRVSRELAVNRDMSERIDAISREYGLSFSDVLNLTLKHALDGKRMPWCSSN